jgi:hypothetical protein
VKIVRHSFYSQHPDVFADVAIDGGAQLRSRYLALNLNTRDLPFSMNTGIRAARSMNVNAAAIDQ